MKPTAVTLWRNRVFSLIFTLLFTLFLIAVVAIMTELSPLWSSPIESGEKKSTHTTTSRSLGDCINILREVNGGWCEMRVDGDRAGISNVWPEKQPRIQQALGPRAVLIAWSSAAYDPVDKVLYFMGGGGTDYGGNEIYSFSLDNGKWSRLTDPSELDYYSGNKRPYWIPDTRLVPPASYLSDGILFNEETRTIIVLSTKAAIGARIRGEELPPKDRFLPDGDAPKQYEFNPSVSENRNGLAPLTWRKIGDNRWFSPRTVQLADGTLLLGDSKQLFEGEVTQKGKLKLGAMFAEYKKTRAGNAVLDKRRNWVWSISTDLLLAFNEHGKLVEQLPLPFDSGKAIAFDSRGRIVVWDGNERIYWMDPDGDTEQWYIINWGDKGPKSGDKRRIYGKWVHIQDDIFVGISSTYQGIWVYKHPSSTDTSRPLSRIDIQKIVDSTPDGASIKLPSGLYGRGLRVSKPIDLDLTGVELMGVSGGKGILNIADPGGLVRISNFKADARNNDARNGNLAGIRVTGEDFYVVLDNIEIFNTAIGIMTDNRGGALILNNSVIADIGTYKTQGLSHVLYAGAIDRLIVRDSKLSRSLHLGHILKSRSKFTEVSNSSLLGLDSNHSRVIDISCGGELIVRDSVLQSSSNSDNADFISVGVEKPVNCKRGLVAGKVEISDSLIVFDRGAAPSDSPDRANLNRLFTWRVPLDELILKGNTIIKPGSSELLNEEVTSIRLSEFATNNNIYISRSNAGLDRNVNTPPN